jgi:hypothetical protein
MFPELASSNLKERLSDSSKQFVWVKRGLTPRQREAVMDLRAGRPRLSRRNAARLSAG